MTLYLTTKIRRWKERAAKVEGSWLENKMAALANKAFKAMKKDKRNSAGVEEASEKDARAESTVSPFQNFLYTINNLFINAWIC